MKRLLLLSLLLATTSRAQDLPPGLDGVGWELAYDHLSFERPLWVGHPGDGTDRMVVAEQNGRILIFENIRKVRDVTVMMDVDAYRRHNEEGLLGVAFHPNVAENGYVFLHYSANRPRRGVISRFELDADRSRIRPDTEKTILEVEQPWGNHNGGDLRFGPDGMLYITLGDGGGANDPLRSGQDLSTLLGSILRIDVDHGDPYAIPEDNPFVDVEGARPEIWAYGLRNVWRFSFDRETGELWAGDVGQNRWEEIDLIVPGGNYGWNLREGKHAFRGGAMRSDFIDPVIDYARDVSRSITGGFVYRGTQVPELEGGYIHADYETGYVWVLWWDGDEVTRHHTLGRASRVSSFGEDRGGEVYFTSFDGAVYRLWSKEHSR